MFATFYTSLDGTILKSGMLRRIKDRQPQVAKESLRYT